jgi:hypothetical protein
MLLPGQRTIQDKPHYRFLRDWDDVVREVVCPGDQVCLMPRLYECCQIVQVLTHSFRNCPKLSCRNMCAIHPESRIAEPLCPYRIPAPKRSKSDLFSPQPEGTSSPFCRPEDRA